MRKKKYRFTMPPEIEISYIYKDSIDDHPIITNAEQIHELLKVIWKPRSLNHREEFIAIMLNRANRVLGYYKVSTGGIASTAVDPLLIFQAALKSNASSIIMAHNHPSGSLLPSANDVILAKRLELLGEFIGIKVLDHIIIGQGGIWNYSGKTKI